VKTDARGRARVSFRLPDNLTRFRLMAVASVGAQFGSGESSLTVSKPLMLRPSLPRLARPGDVFDCGVVLHNYSDAGSSVAVSVEAIGEAVSVAGQNLRWLAVASGKAEEIFWQCKAEKTGTTTFRFRAKAFPERSLIHQPGKGERGQTLEAVAGEGEIHTATLQIERNRVTLKILETPKTDDQRIRRGHPCAGSHGDGEQIGGAHGPRTGGDEAVSPAYGIECVRGRKQLPEGIERLRNPRPAHPGVGVIRVHRNPVGHSCRHVRSGRYLAQNIDGVSEQGERSHPPADDKDFRPHFDRRPRGGQPCEPGPDDDQVPPLHG